jgi:hypothetical protein
MVKNRKRRRSENGGGTKNGEEQNGVAGDNGGIYVITKNNKANKWGRQKKLRYHA